MTYVYHKRSFATARTRPAQLLAGLFCGVSSIIFAFGYLVIFAPIFPLFLCALTVGCKRTNAFAVGAFAAFCGLCVYDGALLVAILQSKPTPTPDYAGWQR